MNSGLLTIKNNKINRKKKNRIPIRLNEAEQNKDKDKENKEHTQKVPAIAEPTDEQQQANEQWLKRIPDDPAGLLKRKFKYQYGQRGRQSDNNDW